MTIVPDFFQEESAEALRSQVDWLEEHLGLGTAFFAKLLREDPRAFDAWRGMSGSLAADKEAVLRGWWHTVLHLLAFQDFDDARVRTLLEQSVPTRPEAGRGVFAPPWSAGSLKEYLESHGREGIGEVDRWVESFRFGDPYAPPRKGDSCLSTPA
jgi:hypothetical protein